MLLELLLPGGTLMAVLLYVHQRWRAARGHGVVGAVPPAPAIAVALPARGRSPVRAARRLVAAPAWRAGAC